MFLVLLVFLGLLEGHSLDPVDEDAFRHFVSTYRRHYRGDSFEYHKRLGIFQETINRIKRNSIDDVHHDSAKYGINEFSDLTAKEFKLMFANPNITAVRRKVYPNQSMFKNEALKSQLNSLPRRIDWRDKNAVTAIKNQGKCGACWALSTVQTIESMVAIKTRELRQFSVQQLIDCASNENHGCSGGDTCAALEWMVKSRTKLQLEQDYPTLDGPGRCQDKNWTHGISVVANYTCDNYTNNEIEILKLLAYHGPVIAAVDATGWQDYLGGIIQFHCSNKHNHAVQIVGYDLTGQIPYYIVRNTWGPGFGLNGYIHIAVGKNLCGISDEISAIDVVIL